MPGLGVDLDLADVHAGREGEVGRIVERALLQAGLELLAGELVGDIGLQRHLAEGQPLVGAGDREAAVLELDVAFRGFQHVGRRPSCPWRSTLSSALKMADMPTAPEREP